ncbi:pentapeptide repeat protein [Stanieria sp. NIES-3757]|nr:pentapeptide repeat protein [Stanieria sp. NIES-3757]
MKITVKELKQRYESGQKNFEEISLIGGYLQGVDLRYINLKNSDLSNSDLSDAILYGANLEGANLNRTKLNGTKLPGAFLANATIVCGNLSDADLRDTDLENVSLDAATLKKTILEGADLSGAYLVGVELQKASLSGAYFNNNTCFPENFDPLNQKMLLEPKISLDDLLQKFNYLSQYGGRYLGPMMTVKNWQSSRPEFDWLNQLTVNSSGQITCSNLSEKFINNSQRHFAQKWMVNFINLCSMIIREFPFMIDHEKIIFK